MDREDKRRFLVIGSVTMEIVAPLFQKRVQLDFNRLDMCDLQSYLDSETVKHILFHLCFRPTSCCTDKANCRTNHCYPLKSTTWNFLYQNRRSSAHGARRYSCHCQFTANPVQLKDLNIALSSLILLNCCDISVKDKDAIGKLREMKNEYLTHNINGGITQKEYSTLWPAITNWLLQLDPLVKDDLIRLENRPLDESLYTKYSTELLDIHSKLEELHSEFYQLKDVALDSKRDSQRMMHTIEKSEDATSEMLMVSIEKLEKLNQSYVQLHGIITAMNETTQSQQTEQEKSKREESDMLTAKMEELKISFNQIQSMMTEMKNTAQLQQRESGETQDNEINTQYRCSSELDGPNLAKVRKINKLGINVDQNASSTLFANGAHVEVGTFIMGDQYITVTSADAMSQITMNSKTTNAKRSHDKAFS